MSNINGDLDSKDKVRARVRVRPGSKSRVRLKLRLGLCLGSGSGLDPVVLALMTKFKAEMESKDLVRNPILYMAIIPVSYTHLTLPTICSV